MKKLLVMVLVFTGFIHATNYYVSKKGTNGNGLSWATAWYEMSQIRWSSISPGDVIYLDGGSTEMVYTTNLIPTKGGTAGNRLYIRRSAEAGRSGTVKLNHIEVAYPYITIDGTEWGGIDLYTEGGRGINIKQGSEDFEIRNVRVWSDFAQDNTKGWGSLMYIWAGNALIQDCEFYQTNAEDQLKYLASNKKLVIEGCYFHGLKSTWCADPSYSGGGYWRHADCVQFEKAAQGTDLTVRRTIFTNLGVDCFMTAYADMARAEFSYSVFSRVNDAIKMGSARHLYIYNTVFDRCRGDLVSGSATDLKRNIIYSGRSWSGPVHISGSPQYSLWGIGTTYYVQGNGNLYGDPKFLNPDKPAGADGIPFTADDGFRLRAGSPAINAGTDLGFTEDIAGTPISGKADIGAYEYTNTGVSWQLAESSWQAPPLPSLLYNCQLQTANCQLFNILGQRVQLCDNPGVFLVVPENRNRISRITVVK